MWSKPRGNWRDKINNYEWKFIKSFFNSSIVDVRNKKEIEEAIINRNKSGTIEIAINLAGIANANPAEELSPEQWQTMFDINLTGLFYSCQEEAKVMISRKKGSIINIASMSGSIVNRGLKQVIIIHPKLE